MGMNRPPSLFDNPSDELVEAMREVEAHLDDQPEISADDFLESLYPDAATRARLEAPDRGPEIDTTGMPDAEFMALLRASTRLDR